MKKTLLTLSLTLFAAGAFAQSTAPSTADSDKYNPAAASAAEAKTTKDLLSSRNCVRETGSHIQRKVKDDCVNTTGRSYDKTNMDQTGAMTADKVLPMMDPSITVR